MTPDEVSKKLGVSRETKLKLYNYLFILRKWQKSINLVASSTLENAWQRHILDCGQLAHYLPSQTTKILDVGSGAGLPGLVLAIITGCHVDLVESDQRKAVFISKVVRELDLRAVVHNKRIEELESLNPDVITARALAKLPKLFQLIKKQLHPNSVCLFLKGVSVDEELTNLHSYTTMRASKYESLSCSKGVVLKFDSQSR